MSTVPAFLSDAPLPGSIRHTIKRSLGDYPDVLSAYFLFARKLPPVLALLVYFLGLSHPGAESMLNLQTVSLSVKRLVLLWIVYKGWALVLSEDELGRRAVPRLRFLISQATAVLFAALFCGFLLIVARLLGWEMMPGSAISAFLVRSTLYGLGLVLVTAGLYELAYQVALPNTSVIVGTRSRAVEAYRKLCSHGERRGTVLGFIDNDHSHASRLPQRYLGTVPDLEQVLARNPVNLVYLALPLRSHYAEVQEAIQICERVGVRYVCAPDLFQSVVDFPRGTPMHDLSSTLRTSADYRLLVKRALDLAFGVALILAFLPIGLLVALAVKTTSAGPTFFVQERYGKDRRIFRMYKFRSMVGNAEALQANLETQNEADGPIFKIRQDARVTRVGKVIRMLSLDELPQLFNVVRGDMSLVGPRPMSLRDVHRFRDTSLMQRFSVTPGLTGLWQVSGRSKLAFERWTELDLHYINHWSLALDLKILLRTIPAVLASEGAM